MLPLSRMVSVATSVAGPLYLAAVMGVLIGRFAGNLIGKPGCAGQLPLRQRSNDRCHGSL